MKPRLYLDIDGVLYANYGGDWQLRPYIKTLVNWAAEHFDILWVSYNSRKEKVVEIAAGVGEVVSDYWPYHLDEKGFRVNDDPTWHPRAGLSGKLQAIHHTGGLDDPWLLIEDSSPDVDQVAILEEKGMLDRWVVVPDTGADVLLDLKMVLQDWLKDGKLTVPYEWATRQVAERDLWVNAYWKGYGKSGRGT
jgi:hypothetical protein